MGLTVDVGFEAPTLTQFAWIAAGDFGLKVISRSETTLYLQVRGKELLTTIKIVTLKSGNERVLLTEMADSDEKVALWRLLEAYNRILELSHENAFVDVTYEDD